MKNTKENSNKKLGNYVSKAKEEIFMKTEWSIVLKMLQRDRRKQNELSKKPLGLEIRRSLLQVKEHINIYFALNSRLRFFYKAKKTIKKSNIFPSDKKLNGEDHFQIKTELYNRITFLTF